LPSSKKKAVAELFYQGFHIAKMDANTVGSWFKMLPWRGAVRASKNRRSGAHSHHQVHATIYEEDHPMGILEIQKARARLFLRRWGKKSLPWLAAVSY
jgi:hypothetical protein